MTIDPAWAGHAGDTTVAAFMPHELMGLLVLLLLGLGLLLLLTGATLFKLLRLERRLRAVEAQLRKTAGGDGGGPG